MRNVETYDEEKQLPIAMLTLIPNEVSLTIVRIVFDSLSFYSLLSRNRETTLDKPEMISVVVRRSYFKTIHSNYSLMSSHTNMKVSKESFPTLF